MLPDCLPKLIWKQHTLFADITFKMYIRKLIYTPPNSMVYLATATEQDLSITVTKYCFNFKGSVSPQRGLLFLKKYIPLSMRFMKIKLVCQSSFVFIIGFIKMYLSCPDQTVRINFKYKKLKRIFMKSIPESCETLKKHLDWSQHNPIPHSCK